MGVEIERKYLVRTDIESESETWVEGIIIKQGYLSIDPCVRIRLFNDKRYIPRKPHEVHNVWQACITIKGDGLIKRPEFEYEIPIEDGKELFDMAPYKLKKIRRFYVCAGMEWSVDFFQDTLEGFMLAEVELESEDQRVMLPRWVGDEVTFNKEYANVNLAVFARDAEMYRRLI